MYRGPPPVYGMEGNSVPGHYPFQPMVVPRQPGTVLTANNVPNSLMVAPHGEMPLLPQASHLPLQPPLPPPQQHEDQSPQNAGLVAHLCKIIERQSEEIANLVQNRGGSRDKKQSEEQGVPDGDHQLPAPMPPSMMPQGPATDYHSETRDLDDATGGTPPAGHLHAVRYSDGLEALTVAADGAAVNYPLPHNAWLNTWQNPGDDAYSHHNPADAYQQQAAALEAKNKKRRKEAPANSVGRRCAACGTTETPKWRCAMTLCNACGLLSAKRARRYGMEADGIFGAAAARRQVAAQVRSDFPTGETEHSGMEDSQAAAATQQAAAALALAAAAAAQDAAERQLSSANKDSAVEHDSMMPTSHESTDVETRSMMPTANESSGASFRPHLLSPARSPSSSQQQPAASSLPPTRAPSTPPEGNDDAAELAPTEPSTPEPTQADSDADGAQQPPPRHFQAAPSHHLAREASAPQQPLPRLPVMVMAQPRMAPGAASSNAPQGMQAFPRPQTVLNTMPGGGRTTQPFMVPPPNQMPTPPNIVQFSQMPQMTQYGMGGMGGMPMPNPYLSGQGHPPPQVMHQMMPGPGRSMPQPPPAMPPPAPPPTPQLPPKPPVAALTSESFRFDER